VVALKAILTLNAVGLSIPLILSAVEPARQRSTVSILQLTNEAGSFEAAPWPTASGVQVSWCRFAFAWTPDSHT
jgi:hypothetical protein